MKNVFYKETICNLVDVYDISEQNTASIMREFLLKFVNIYQNVQNHIPEHIIFIATRDLNRQWTFSLHLSKRMARGSAVGWGTMLQAGRSRVWSLPSILPSSRTMVLGSTQSLAERVPGIFLGVKGGRRLRLTTSPPSVSQYLENVGASMYPTPLGLQGPLQG
jgi:hypothetical protein